MLLFPHSRFYEEIFSLPNFLKGPLLSFGVQDIDSRLTFDGQYYPDLSTFLNSQNIQSFSLDLFDPRATFRHDMNMPINIDQYGHFQTVIDIGSFEHIFDTRRCLENCLRLVAVGGHYMLHTPVNGYFSHGMHVFQPEAIIDALELNGFRIIYQKYSQENGTIVQDPSEGGDILLWIVAMKERELGQFTCPQQSGWRFVYRKSTAPTNRRATRKLPRGKLAIRIFLPRRYTVEKYQCTLMTAGNVAVADLKTDAVFLDGLTSLIVKADLSVYSAGDYLLAIRSQSEKSIKYRIRIVDEFAITWLRL